MEREYKWKSTAQDFDDILTYLALTETEPVSMFAQYYDTADRLLRSRKIALRMRTESGENCGMFPMMGCTCMKNMNARRIIWNLV